MDEHRSEPNFFAELKRRNVIRMAGLYVVGAWLVTQVASTVLPMFSAPEWVPRSIVLLLAIGFIPALIFAWVFEFTPDGLKRDADVPIEHSISSQTARRMKHMTVALLLLALGYFTFDKFVLAPRREAAIAASATVAGEARATAKAATIPDKSIAVLPFANTSGDPANEYLSDGMSEEMINTLGKLGDLKVIGRNSSFQFKGKADDPAMIAAKLGVAYLLEGSVQKAADKLRIGVQLVKAADGSNVWTQSYDRDLKDIFAVQSEIATAVAQQLQSTLLANGNGDAHALKPDAPPSGKVEAYQALLQGNFLLERRNEADIRKAIGFYRQAVAIDPAYAFAWARLGYANAQLIGYFTPTTKAERDAVANEARQAVATATRLAPDLAEVHRARARQALTIDHDLATALREAQRAVTLAPQDAGSLIELGILQGLLGQSTKAIGSYQHALTLDPLSARAQYDMSLQLLSLGENAEAEAALRRAIELQPQASPYRAYLAVTQLQQGKSAEAVVSAQQEPDPFWRTWALAMVQWAAGDHAASDAALATLIREDADDAGSQIAAVYAQRKQPDEMFRWLEHARQTGDGGVAEILQIPFLDDYKDNPRFIAFARKVGVMPAEGAPPGSP